MSSHQRAGSESAGGIATAGDDGAHHDAPTQSPGKLLFVCPLLSESVQFFRLTNNREDYRTYSTTCHVRICDNRTLPHPDISLRVVCSSWDEEVKFGTIDVRVLRMLFAPLAPVYFERWP